MYLVVKINDIIGFARTANPTADGIATTRLAFRLSFILLCNDLVSFIVEELEIPGIIAADNAAVNASGIFKSFWYCVVSIPYSAVA